MTCPPPPHKPLLEPEPAAKGPTDAPWQCQAVSTKRFLGNGYLQSAGQSTIAAVHFTEKCRGYLILSIH